MKTKLLPILLLLASAFAWGDSYNMRKCLVLPVTDSAGNALGYKIYEGVEAYLKESAWCDYVSSAELIEVFSKYRDRLRSHLKDENVLKTVASRLKAGSLIRIDLEYDVNQVTVQLDVVGENGRDIYFSEREVLKEVDVDRAIETVKNWLEVYETTIPYDGKVLGVLGDQVTFTYPRNANVSVGQGFRVRRFVKKSKHPLLKKVVEWNTEMVARGKVFNVNNSQALGLIKIYEKNTKIEPGDWIALEEDFTPAQALDDVTYPEVEANQFGKLGFVSLFFDVSSSAVGTNTDDNNKATGLTYGVGVEVEAWLTREFFAVGSFSRRLGTLKEQSGNLDLESLAITSGAMKIGGGYKYLPMGFFYGPQINFTAGYANYTYDVEESAGDGFGQNSISGIFLGIGGNMPLQKGVRVFGGAEFIPFSTFEDEDNIFGSEKSSSSMVFRAGVKYQYSPLISLDGAFEVQNNSAKFKGGNTSQVSYKDSIFKLGGSFIF